MGSATLPAPAEDAADYSVDARPDGTVECRQFVFDGWGNVLGGWCAVPNRKRPWTAEDDRRLLELRALGRSSMSIAMKLRRSPGAIDTRLNILRKKDRNSEIDRDH
jgi:hypothetical protein